MHTDALSTPDAVRRSIAGDRWFAVSTSAVADSWQSGANAARAAVRDADAKLLMVFCQASQDPGAVLAGVRSVTRGAALIGCSTTAVIGPADYHEEPSVAVVALGGPGFSVVTRAAGDVAGRQRSAGEQVAGCGADFDDRQYKALVLLTDGMVARPGEILAGAYSVVGASMPMVGGASCPAPPGHRAYQFYDDQVMTNAVVGAVIGSDAPMGIGLRHGWRRVGEPMIVTKSAYNVVHTLDDEPAARAYLRRLGAPPQAFFQPSAFERFAERRPLGVRSRSGDVVRNVGSSVHLTDGWLCSSGDVPEGALVWPMEGDTASVLDAAGDACHDAVATLGERKPLGMIAFDCETRARFLGPDGRRREIATMRAQAPATPLAGLYTWGEIARTTGVNGFHNHTLVALAVS